MQVCDQRIGHRSQGLELQAEADTGCEQQRQDRPPSAGAGIRSALLAPSPSSFQGPIGLTKVRWRRRKQDERPDHRSAYRHHHDLARLGALSRTQGLRVGRRQPHLSRDPRPDRPPAGGDGGGRLAKGQTVAFLSANSAETWCAGVAASGLGLVTTWLHPLGALADHLDVIEDAGASALIVDPGRMPSAAASSPPRRPTGWASCSPWAAAGFRPRPHGGRRRDRRGERRSISRRPDDYAIINYTGGTTGKSKGAIRRHRSTAAMSVAVSADFEFPAMPRYLAAAPITHVAGTKVVPTLLRGGTVHLHEGLRAGEIPGHPRAREDQLHPRGADHDLRAAGPSRGSTRPISPRSSCALRRLADVADSTGRGAGAHRADLQPALRPDRMLSGERAAQDRPRRKTPRAVRLLRLSHRLVQREPARRRQQRGGAGRGGRDLRARPARDGGILEAPRADARRPSRAAGCTPATSRAPTSAATSISSIARRT